MTLSERFVVAAGSVTGRDHRRAERDGQDGFATVATPDVVAAVVTDGCSSGRASEVGARLGAAWIAALLAEHGPRPAVVLARLVERLGDLARSLSASGRIDPGAVSEMLLFGFLAAVVTRDEAMVFGVGDGAFSVDGAATAIDPGPDNAPAYPAYALLGARIEPRVWLAASAREASAIAVATDGVDLASLAEIAADRRLDANPSLVRKRLVVLSDAGRFADDATVGLLRRRRTS